MYFGLGGKKKYHRIHVIFCHKILLLVKSGLSRDESFLLSSRLIKKFACKVVILEGSHVSTLGKMDFGTHCLGTRVQKPIFSSVVTKNTCVNNKNKGNFFRDLHFNDPTNDRP